MPEQCSKPTIQPMRKRDGLVARYIWLVYSAFFFVQPILDHSLREWLIFVPWFAAFLFCYIYPDVNPRAGVWCVLGMLALGLGYVPFNEGIAGVFIFVGAFIPFVIVDLAWALASLALLACIICGEGLLFHLHTWVWTTMAVVTTVVGGANLSHAQEKGSSARLMRAQEEIEHLATIAERERIARDLHDVLGHTLSMITLKAELAGKLLASDPNRAATEIADVEQTARRALAEVREAVGGYRAQGLASELARARQTLASAGVELDADAPPHGIPAGEETVLALIVREAVTNIVRHAGATRCQIAFATKKEQITLQIQDNGAGTANLLQGNGLRGMRERAEALGGSFEWKAMQGIQLAITLPLPAIRPLAVTEAADVVTT